MVWVTTVIVSLLSLLSLALPARGASGPAEQSLVWGGGFINVEAIRLDLNTEMIACGDVWGCTVSLDRGVTWRMTNSGATDFAQRAVAAVTCSALRTPSTGGRSRAPT